ncbi:MAG: LLM class flavin-dependent oxidoreductase [Sphingobacteriales bacterium]|nr:MAG: LLM class flavin-dependent oxidoreductase [Sphingobacteriales bacterium]
MLQFGLSTFADLGELSPQQRFRNLLEEGQLADQMAFDVFAIGEHHRSDYAVSAPPVALGGIAAVTKNIRLSSAVTVLSSEDPVRVFQQFATLDNISGGRAEIMAGRGSFTESFPLFGYDLQDYETLFAEKLDLLVKLCRNGVVSASGKHVQSLQEVTVYPRPIQDPLPLWVAVGGTPESVIRAGRYNLPLTLAIIGGRWAHFMPYVELYRKVLAEADHGNAQICINQHCYVAEDSQQAAAEFYPAHHGVFSRIGRERGWQPGGQAEFDAALRPEGHLLVGSPQQLIDKLCAEQDAFGNTRFLLQTSIGNLPHKKVLDSIELLATKVIPAVRQHVAHTKNA